MRPAHLLTILFATTLLIGCGPNVVDLTRMANEDGEGFRRWDDDDLSEGSFYYEGKPFTGLGELVGEEFFDDGIFSVRIPFKKGKIDFSAGWEAFYASGQIAARCEEFQGGGFEDCYNGRLESWYMTGQLSRRANYMDGELDGLYEEWYENGQLDERGNYKEGELDGPYEEWHENGQLYERVNYKEGYRDGLYELWYENGQLFRRYNYMDGELDGLYEEWHENGQLSDRVNYKEGYRDGPHEEWYENGQPK